MKYVAKLSIGLLFSGLSMSVAHAQGDTEFSKGFIAYAGLHNGLITDFGGNPDLFVGGLYLAPQVTVVPHFMRAGILAGGFYSANRIDGDVGPSVSIKLKTFDANLKGAGVGSLGNLHLRVEHLWGTGKQRLFGGGLFLDAGNFLLLGVTGHRDYRLNTWWFQSQIAVRISKKTKLPEI